MTLNKLSRGFLSRTPNLILINEENGLADGSFASAFRLAVETQLTKSHVPGAQVAVRRDGELLWSVSAGRPGRPVGIDPENETGEREVGRRDRFVIASITKLIIACVTMSLVERGKLDIDSMVERWLPELPNADRISLRMLLGHRSGLREYFEDHWVRETIIDEPLRSWSRSEVLEAIARLGSERQPNKQFAYRNTNYIVIGEILEKLTGKTVGRLVQEIVSSPLGLSTLSFDEECPFGGRLAAPHMRFFANISDPSEDTGGLIQTDALGEVWTDGGIVSSADDLAVFTEALFGGKLLRSATVEAMSMSPDVNPGVISKILRRVSRDASERSYGLGTLIEDQGVRRLLGHDGMYLGWSSISTFDTRSRVTITILTNLFSPSMPAHRLRKALLEVLDGKL